MKILLELIIEKRDIEFSERKNNMDQFGAKLYEIKQTIHLMNEKELVELYHNIKSIHDGTLSEITNRIVNRIKT